MRPSRRQMPPSTRPWQPGQPSATAVLIALTAAAASAQWLFVLVDRGEILQDGAMADWMGLSANSASQGRWWQFISFMFLHAGPFPLHLAANLLVLYFAGREVEPIVGTRHFLGLFFGGNLLGGLSHWIASSQGWIPSDQILLGTSAGVMAIVAAYSTVLPELEVPGRRTLLFPFRFRAKFIGLSIAAAAALMWIAQVGLVIGPEAILASGMLGWMYVKKLGFGSPLPFQRYVFEKRQREARLSRMPVDQFICEEIDPILDKIATQGLQSLTRGERKILERCREKMGTPATTPTVVGSH
jgi:membrane associated rhomboid family serine protease